MKAITPNFYPLPSNISYYKLFILLTVLQHNIYSNEWVCVRFSKRSEKKLNDTAMNILLKFPKENDML